jgi:hypothetical protein
MTVRKVNQLIQIAEEYQMHPLVHYYKLKIELIRLQKKYDELVQRNSGVYHRLQ